MSSDAGKETLELINHFVTVSDNRLCRPYSSGTTVYFSLTDDEPAIIGVQTVVPH